MKQPELPFGLLLKKAIRGDTHAVTIEEALEHLETIAKARVDASVDPEVDPNARVNMWLNQSKDYLNDNEAMPEEQDMDCLEPLDEAAVTLRSLSMIAPGEEKGERSKQPKEGMDQK